MPLPVINNTVRVAISGITSRNTGWANVLHFRTTGPAISAALIDTLHTEIAKLYTGPAYTGGLVGLKQPLSSQMSCKFAKYTPLDGLSATTVKTFAWSGTSTGDALPPQVAICISLRTNTRGRRYRGRLYLPQPSEAASSGQGMISQADADGLDAQCEGFRAALPALSWEWVIASYGKSKTKTGLVTWTPFATPLTSVSVDRILDTQRRRAR